MMPLPHTKILSLATACTLCATLLAPPAQAGAQSASLAASVAQACAEHVFGTGPGLDRLRSMGFGGRGKNVSGRLQLDGVSSELNIVTGGAGCRYTLRTNDADRPTSEANTDRDAYLAAVRRLGMPETPRTSQGGNPEWVFTGESKQIVVHMSNPARGKRSEMTLMMRILN